MSVRPASLASARWWQRALASLLLCVCTIASASPSATANSRSYQVTAPDGVALAVQEHGAADGQAIVFVHGLLGSRIDWDAQLADPQLQGYRLITYDLRGHGLSGKPTAASAYREGLRWADDLAAVLKTTGARNAVLVGWSLQLQPRAQTVLYPDAGHAPFLEDSVRFNQDLLRFVEQIGGAP
ncbi:hypothetical protein XAXN_16065 [Xanthomonas axonopodis]|uniref:AB hydrolase-1 domain-containing protein n=1 Tax=Xanthomonas axonopodis TaxID=53413 RepID=A0A0P6VD46_9XANT|nr:alpha/beta fold hydrolase [Xanthomonas axonopodis]KPL48027.1 hypothetical protein XAXN_16065 [Xanthomonas axonopodis]